MKNLFLLLVLLMLSNTAWSQTQTGTKITVEHPGFLQYTTQNPDGTYTISCNTNIDEVCYKTESYDARCATSINLNTHNGPITPFMNIDLIVSSIWNVNINIVGKYTYILNPATPFTITHVFILQ